MDREQDIPFIYEDGVLKPQGPVDFPEGTRGVAHIRDASPAVGGSERRRALETIRRLGKSGAFDSGGRMLTRDEMHERA